MNFAAIRKHFMSQDPSLQLPPLVESLEELQKFFEEWVKTHSDKRPKIVPSDGGPPLFCVGFYGFYVDSDGKETGVHKGVLMENITNPVYLDEKGQRDRVIDLREHFDKLTTYADNVKRVYLDVKEDGTVDLPPGTQLK